MRNDGPIRKGSRSNCETLGQYGKYQGLNEKRWANTTLGQYGNDRDINEKRWANTEKSEIE